MSATAAPFSPETRENFVDTCASTGKKAYCCGTLAEGTERECTEVTKTGLLGGLLGDVDELLDNVVA
jgi:hypothetical protein